MPGILVACENCDALTAQVVVLWQALETAEREVWAWQTGADAYGYSSLMDYHPAEFEPSAVLADTAEAAARCQREQRLEGAKAIAKLASLQHRENCQSYPGKTDACTPDCPLRVLAEMEREAGQ